MPLGRREFIQVGLLLLCVPLQYFICTYFGDSENQRSVAIDRLLTGFSRFKRSYFVWDNWQRWCQSIVRGLQFQLGYSQILDSKDPLGECPALEVIQHRGTKMGYFTESPHIRVERPNEVRYRIGQVVVHKEQGYRGVIVGWDTNAKNRMLDPDIWSSIYFCFQSQTLDLENVSDLKTIARSAFFLDLLKFQPKLMKELLNKLHDAPQSWLHKMHQVDKSHWREMANYAVLVDTRDRKVPHKTYEPEENFIAVKSTKIFNPWLDDYFDGFDGNRYIPRRWLKILYPRD